MPVMHTIKTHLGLCFPDRGLSVRADNAHANPELSLPGRPLGNYSDAGMDSRECRRVYILKEAHETQFSTHLLAYVVTDYGEVERRFYLFCHNSSSKVEFSDPQNLYGKVACLC